MKAILVSIIVTAVVSSVQRVCENQKLVDSIVNYNFTPPYFYVGLFQVQACEHEMCPTTECRVHDPDSCFTKDCEVCRVMESIRKGGRSEYFIGAGRMKQPSLDCTVCSCPPDDYCQPGYRVVPGRVPDFELR